MELETLLEESRPFLAWAVAWYNGLERLPLDDLVADPAGTAILSVDLIEGFCRLGPLASDRVAGIIAPIVTLMQSAHRRGVQHFVLLQDHHAPDAIEFDSYAPHCVAGSKEAETVSELAELPFSNQFVLLKKNSISSTIGTELVGWLDAHPEIKTFVVVGDCTDLCIYQLAMDLRLRANALQLPGVRVIVPVDGVQTYHLPPAVAQQIGVVPHDGDLLHLLFLYSMMLNGIEVVAGVK